VAVVGTLWLRVDNATYAGYFARLSPAGLLAHLASAGQAYAFALVELFGLSFGRLANMPVLLALAGLIGWGLVRQLRRGPDAVVLFVLLYAAALIAYPVHMEPTRYALPILPLLLWLALEPLRRLPPAAALAVLAVLYLPFYRQHDARALAPLTADSADRHARQLPPGLRDRGTLAARCGGRHPGPACRRLSRVVRERRLPAARYSRRSNRSLTKLAMPFARKSRRSASSSYSCFIQSRKGSRPSASA
jgi:hypothetical protein